MASQSRTVIITGANKGLGYELIKNLLSGATPYKIILTARSDVNGEKAIAELKQTHSKSTSSVTFKKLDLDDPTSVDAFVAWVKSDLGTYDVLVDNAALGAFPETSAKQRADTVKTNVINTIALTEKLLPYLSDDGKIIALSSTFGSLKLQSKQARQILEDPSITTEGILKVAEKLVERYEKGDEENDFGFKNGTYHATKALLNTYIRFPLVKKVKSGQQVYSVCPGWCKTDMGGAYAPLTPEQGAETSAYLINLPFKVNKDINGKFVRDLKVIAWDEISGLNLDYVQVFDE